MKAYGKCIFNTTLTSRYTIQQTKGVHCSTVPDHMVYNEPRASVMCIRANAYLICIAIGAVVYECQFVHTLSSPSASLSLFIALFCCCFFFFPCLSFADLPSPHSFLHFSPYLQFSPSVTLSANLHHTTHRQREGEDEKCVE